MSFTEALNPDNFRWPKGKANTLNRTQDKRSVVALESCCETRFSLMVSGYKEAADKLIMTASTPWERNTQIYPILHLYRHFLELALKEIVFRFGEAAAVEPASNDHSLVRQWIKVKEILKHFGVKADTEADKKVNGVIESFNSVDKDSTAFRYSLKPDGSPSDMLTDQVDLSVVLNDMGEVYMYFCGTVGYLGDLFEASGC